MCPDFLNSTDSPDWPVRQLSGWVSSSPSVSKVAVTSLCEAAFGRRKEFRWNHAQGLPHFRVLRHGLHCPPFKELQGLGHQIAGKSEHAPNNLLVALAPADGELALEQDRSRIYPGVQVVNGGADRQILV